MNKLITKARSGVTLVELLVVILIVTILSVSMLPLLQPFVTEAQYAAEAIPVIGNLRTKIGLYQYDKGFLPHCNNDAIVQSWIDAASGNADEYDVAEYTISSGTLPATWNSGTHFGNQIDVDFQDLKGKRSKPLHYQYFPISITNYPSYVVGCFGNGNGLKAGTGYAVCELNYPKKKYIGTWKRYKPSTTNVVAGAITFCCNDPNDTEYCYVPDANTFAGDITDPSANQSGIPSAVQSMIDNGWEF